jgi:uncharacterized protein YbcI
MPGTQNDDSPAAGELPAEDPPALGELAAAISNAVVRIMAAYTGRGPTKARTYIHDDLISIVLQDTLTKAERSLHRDGESELVLANRRAFQKTMGPELVAAIQRHSGRRVTAFMSANHITPDLAIESFVLAPRAAAESTSDDREGGARDDCEGKASDDRERG